VARALLTVGEIARRTGYPIHRVEYVVRARGIREAGRAGPMRVFSEADLDYILHELRRIDSDRGTSAPEPEEAFA
jgi:DNA-binding transcriptional MerR regulator